MSSTSRQSGGSNNLSVGEGGSSSSASRPQPTQAERTADARKAFISSLGVAAKDIDADLQSRAKSIHSNSAALTKQEKQLQEYTKRLSKENKELEKWLEKSNKKLAELDALLDFDDGGDGLEDDLDDLEFMLNAMDAKSDQGQPNKSHESTTTQAKR